METNTELVKFLERQFKEQNAEEIVKKLDSVKIDANNTLQYYTAVRNDFNFDYNFFKFYLRYKQTLNIDPILAFNKLDKLLRFCFYMLYFFYV